MHDRQSSTDPGRSYLARVTALLQEVLDTQWDAIALAAEAVAGALQSGREIHAFGSGHSHMLAEELFYRAGGLVDVRPILFEALMLHANAPLSTRLERLPGLASEILEDHRVSRGDVLLVFSNSGRNQVATELATEARDRGITVIAITSLQPLSGHEPAGRLAAALRDRRHRDRQPGRAGRCGRRSAGLRPPRRSHLDRRRRRDRQRHRRPERRARRRRRSRAEGLREQQHRCGRRDQRHAAGAAAMSSNVAAERPQGPAFGIRGVVEGFYGTPGRTQTGWR